MAKSEVLLRTIIEFDDAGTGEVRNLPNVLHVTEIRESVVQLLKPYRWLQVE